MPKAKRSSDRAATRSRRAQQKKRAIVLDAIDELHIVGEVLRNAPILARFTDLSSDEPAGLFRTRNSSQIGREGRISPIPPEAIDLAGANTGLILIAAWRLERLALMLATLIQE